MRCPNCDAAMTDEDEPCPECDHIPRDPNCRCGYCTENHEGNDSDVYLSGPQRDE
jgi:hypothetical protein